MTSRSNLELSYDKYDVDDDAVSDEVEREDDHGSAYHRIGYRNSSHEHRFSHRNYNKTNLKILLHIFNQDKIIKNNE